MLFSVFSWKMLRFLLVRGSMENQVPKTKRSIFYVFVMVGYTKNS